MKFRFVGESVKNKEIRVRNLPDLNFGDLLTKALTPKKHTEEKAILGDQDA